MNDHDSAVAIRGAQPSGHLPVRPETSSGTTSATLAWRLLSLGMHLEETVGRFLAFVALIVILSDVDCSGPPQCLAPVEPDAEPPVQGAWELVLEQPAFTGTCEGIDTEALVATRLRAELGLVDGQLVHLDLEGVHLEGALWSNQVYAEGWSDAGFMRDEGEGLRLPLGVVLDGWFTDPRHLDGELMLIIEGERGPCEATAWFTASLVEPTGGQPRLCDEPVPMDESAPVVHPESDQAMACG